MNLPAACGGESCTCYRIDEVRSVLYYDVNPVLTFSHLSIHPGERIRIPEVSTQTLVEE